MNPASKSLLCVLSLAIGMVTGCSRSSTTEESGTAAPATTATDAPAPAATSPGKTRFVNIGTAPQGGVFAVVGATLAKVLDTHKPEAEWIVTPKATKGSQENIRRLAKSELDFAMSNAAITYFAVRGGGDWKEAQPVKAVMTLAPNVAFFITPKSSGIKTIADLKGKRVVIGPAGAGFEYFVTPILEAHGISMTDITPLYGAQTAAVDMLLDGSAAAAFLGGAIPTGSIVTACTSGDMYFIPFDEEKRKKLIEDYAFFNPATVPAGTYKGQDQDFVCMNVGSMHFITAANADEDLVYKVTKIIYDNRAEVAAEHPAGKAINEKNAARNVGTEFHPGAIKYYKEIGIWKE